MKDFLPIPVPRPVSQEDFSLAVLTAHYQKIKSAIKRRISEFRAIIAGGKEDEIFSELCFCILTANANALKCHEAIKELCRRDLLIRGRACQIRPSLKGMARFHNKKADYIVRARKLFKEGSYLNIVDRLDGNNIIDIRDRFVNAVKGYGYKEASHFLRNIGLGADIAILDRHILKNLKGYGVISRIPPSIGARKVYVGIEERMRSFSKKIGIPMDELDLLFWSMQTGFIFK